jgi:hypothetical protein
VGCSVLSLLVRPLIGSRRKIDGLGAVTFVQAEISSGGHRKNPVVNQIGGKVLGPRYSVKLRTVFDARRLSGRRKLAGVESTGVGGFPGS